MSESMSMESCVDESRGVSRWITLTARRVLGFWWFERKPYRDEAKMLTVWDTIAEEERAFWRACTCDRGLFTVGVPPRADCPAHFPAGSVERAGVDRG